MAHFQVPVSDYMTSPVHTIGHTAELEEADRLLRRHGISALAVMGAEKTIVGVISRTDLLQSGDAEPGETLRLPAAAVETVMTSPALAMGEGEPLAAAAKKMLDGRIHRVFATRDGRVSGVLSTRELMRAVHDQGTTTPIKEVASKSVVKVRSTDPIALAIERLDLSNKRGLVVVQDGWPVGIFSQADALLARAHDGQTPVEEVMDPRLLVLPGSLPIARAGQQSLAMGVRRIVIVDDGVEGIISGLDFARVMR